MQSELRFVFQETARPNLGVRLRLVLAAGELA